jgi:hypothetical protein
MQTKIYDGTALEHALKNEGLAAAAALELFGMVKTSDQPGYIKFTRAGCDAWIDLPTGMIEKAEHMGQTRRKDHSHPLVKITIKEQQNSEARVLATLLTPSIPVPPPSSNFAMSQPVPMPSQFTLSTRAAPGYTVRTVRNQPSTTRMQPVSAITIGGGGVGLPGGTTNAWGCWDSCCESRCTAGHYEAGPTGWQWVCDDYECVDPCQRCIWPW